MQVKLFVHANMVAERITCALVAPMAAALSSALSARGTDTRDCHVHIHIILNNVHCLE